MPDRPNTVFSHVDNLGVGEDGCYGSGALRGAETRRTDRFASEDLELPHHVVEPQRTPTRSALMMRRYPKESAAREQFISAGAPLDFVPETGGVAGV